MVSRSSRPLACARSCSAATLAIWIHAACPQSAAQAAGLAASAPKSSTSPAPSASSSLHYVKASNTSAGDGFAMSVAISGDTLVVGAPYEDSAASGVGGDSTDDSLADAGAAYVYVRSGSSWILQAYVKASNPDMRDNFGAAVAISGDTIVVGAPAEDSTAHGVDGPQGNDDATFGASFDAGAAYVFVRTGATWRQQAYLKAVKSNVSLQFGSAVSVDGDMIAIGAWNDASGATGVDGNPLGTAKSQSGAAYVFRRASGSWHPDAYLKASNTGAGDEFGRSVAISGDTIVVGAQWEDSAAVGVNGDQSNELAESSGAAYVFRRAHHAWSQVAYLKASDTHAWDRFGAAVSISADTIAVGAPGESSSAAGIDGAQLDESAYAAGACYVFVRTSSGWQQQAYAKAQNPGVIDEFGGALAIRGDMLVVAATGEDASLTGIDGSPIDEGTPNSGAAYVYTRAGATWRSSGYLKAANTGEGDAFGVSIGVSAGRVIAGAPFEDSDAVGVDGAGSDASVLFDAGAAYAIDVDLDVCGCFPYGLGLGSANVLGLSGVGSPVVGGAAHLIVEHVPPGGALTALSLASGSVPLLGGVLLLDASSTVVFPGYASASAGQASYVLAIPSSPELGGQRVYVQSFAADATQTFGVALSNGLEVRICP